MSTTSSARTSTTGQPQRGGLAAVAGPALLALGVGWLLFALAIPQFGYSTPKAFAILFGLLLFASAVSELAAAMTAERDWQPTHALMAFLFVVGGVFALVWPGPTVTVVARLVAWYLLVKGIHDVATAFAQQRVGRQVRVFGTDSGGLHGGSPWWAPLAVGGFSIGIAFWAAAYPGESVVLLTLWVSLAALVTGLTKIASAFRPRAAEVEAEADLTAATGFGARAAAEPGRPTETRVRPPTG